VAVVAGWSVVTEQYSQAPLQLHRPLYLDTDLYPTVFLKTPSSGLLGGDKHRLAVHAAEDSTIKILNQSATLVYPGASEQIIEIDIADGATVFFEPCPLILAAGASLTQTVRIEMSATSRVGFGDVWSARRLANYVCWRFERFDNTIEIFMAGSLKYRERFVLEPLKTSPGHALIGHYFTRFQSVYCFGPWQDSELEKGDQPPDDQQQNDQQQNDQQQNNHLAWRLKRPCGTIDRLLSASSTAQAADD
jgi:urease accessory protein UreH